MELSVNTTMLTMINFSGFCIKWAERWPSANDFVATIFDQNNNFLNFEESPAEQNSKEAKALKKFLDIDL